MNLINAYMTDIVLAQEDEGFNFIGDILPDAEALRILLGAAVTWAIFAFVGKFIKGTGPWQFMYTVFTKLALFIALGAAAAAIPIVGTQLSKLLQEWGVAAVSIATICFIIVLAAEFAPKFPAKLAAKALLMLTIGAIGGFAALQAPELAFFNSGLQDLSTLIIDGAIRVLKFFSDFLTWVKSNKSAA